jgi:putative NADH-flavin reductase
MSGDTIALFGATGRTGRRLLEAALGAGRTVRALVRDPGRLEPRPGLTVLAGDVLDPATVARAVEGTAGALVALGGGTTAAPGTTRSQGMRTIVEALERAGIDRLVAVGGGGVLDSTTGPGLRSEQPGYPEVFRHVTAEHRAAWECLRASSLDWTYVCPPDIPDADATGVYRTAADVMPERPKALPTGDLAAFMVQEFAERRFSRRRVGICT